MPSEEHEDLERDAQTDVIIDLSERIGEALNYLDWLSASTDIPLQYTEQLMKILDGGTEH